MKPEPNYNFRALYFILVLILIQRHLTSGYSLKQLTKPVDHGNSPVWDTRSEALFFVDKYNGALHDYDIDSGDMSSLYFNGTVTTVIPCESNENTFIVGVERDVVAVEWDGGGDAKKHRLTHLDREVICGKADRDGRLWFGTAAFDTQSGKLEYINKGSVYLMTSENIEEPDVVFHPMNFPGGMAWNQNNDKFYVVDVWSHKIKEFDYDENCGYLYNPKVVFNPDRNDTFGRPYGLTVDIDDNLWISMYGGGIVLQYDPKEGRILQEIDVPAQYVTSNCWGGDNYDILYVTTSRRLLSHEERQKQPQAGSVFVITGLETSGVPGFRSKIVNIF